MQYLLRLDNILGMSARLLFIGFCLAMPFNPARAGDIQLEGDPSGEFAKVIRAADFENGTVSYPQSLQDGSGSILRLENFPFDGALIAGISVASFRDSRPADVLVYHDLSRDRVAIMPTPLEFPPKGLLKGKIQVVQRGQGNGQRTVPGVENGKMSILERTARLFAEQMRAGNSREAGDALFDAGAMRSYKQLGIWQFRSSQANGLWDDRDEAQRYARAIAAKWSQPTARQQRDYILEKVRAAYARKGQEALGREWSARYNQDDNGAARFVNLFLKAFAEGFRADYVLDIIMGPTFSSDDDARLITISALVEAMQGNGVTDQVRRILRIVIPDERRETVEALWRFLVPVGQ